WLGDNTDVTGFLAPLQASGTSWQGKRAVVLGCGGSARAVVAALVELGCGSIALAGRNAAKQQALLASCRSWAPQLEALTWQPQSTQPCQSTGLEGALAEARLVVNTTPVGMASASDPGAKGRCPLSPLELAALQPQTCVYDLIYTPRPTALLAALKEANRAIARAATGNPDLTGMGTTATAALLEDGILYLVHVGDSRAYLIREGRIIQVTQDHSVVAEMVRRGTLAADAAESHPARHVITRALGVDADIDIDAMRVDLEPGDVVLLCTDGLSGPVTDDEMLEVVEAALTLEDAAELLVQRANAAGGPDNVTVVLARVDAVTREAATTRCPRAAHGASSRGQPTGAACAATMRTAISRGPR
ncbi:MAG: SpoIIE family protein phosphatase, partial [Miltoncostaeaceae bacterium]